jgi:hypothetical protein
MWSIDCVIIFGEISGFSTPLLGGKDSKTKGMKEDNNE